MSSACISRKVDKGKEWIALFAVELLTDAAKASIDANPDNAWISEQEVRSERAADGRSVSDTVELLMKAGFYTLDKS